MADKMPSDKLRQHVRQIHGFGGLAMLQSDDAIAARHDARHEHVLDHDHESSIRYSTRADRDVADIDGYPADYTEDEYAADYIDTTKETK